MLTWIVPPAGHDTLSETPWAPLVGELHSLGHTILETSRAPARCEAVISINHQPRASREAVFKEVAVDRRALLVFEPEVTAPLTYTKRVRRQYGTTFTASPLWALDSVEESFTWPQNLASLPTPPSRPGPFGATLIAAQKRSASEQSLYGLRRQVIRAANQRRFPLGVVGQGWDDGVRQRLFDGSRGALKSMSAGRRPRIREAYGHLWLAPRHTLGPIASKMDALSLAPATIVIENSRDYVSEKLVDAVVAGVLPVYVGPPLNSFGFPSDIALQVAADPLAVLETLEGLTTNDFQDFHGAAKDWLGSPGAKSMTYESVFRDLAARLDRALRA